MAQAVIPKASPEAIFFGGGLIEVGLLANLGINNNNILYGIPNVTPFQSNLCYGVAARELGEGLPGLLGTSGDSQSVQVPGTAYYVRVL